MNGKPLDQRAASNPDGFFRLHSSEAGAGRCVLLIHGLGWDSRLWEHVCKQAPHGYRFILPDLRGHGASDCPPGPFSIADMASDVATVLRDQAIDRLAIVGFSLGVPIAVSLALDHGFEIDALVLIGGSVWSSPVGEAGTDAMLERAAKAGPRAFAQEQAGMIWRGEWAERHPEEVAAFIERRSAMNQDALHRTFRAGRGLDLRPRLRELSQPTLVVAADDDPFLPIEDARALAAALPAAQFSVIRDSGHMIPLEQSQAFEKALFRFLRATWPPQRGKVDA